MTDRASAEDINELHSLIAARLALRERIESLIDDDEAAYVSVALIRAALRDTGPRPDSGICIFDWQPEGASFGPCPACGSDEPHIRLTGPRPDSGIDPKRLDAARYSRTRTHGYHTHPTGMACPEYVVGQCAFALSTPRTETSETADTVRIGSKTYLAGSDDD